MNCDSVNALLLSRLLHTLEDTTVTVAAANDAQFSSSHTLLFWQWAMPVSENLIVHL